MLVTYKVDSGIAIIKLNRAEKYNAFIRQMSLDLQDALRKADKDETVRAILFIGEGKAFCAGQDLAEALDPSGPGIRKIVAEHYNPIILLLRQIEKPIVCAVNGVAAGAGANIALACDIVLAGKSATFIQAFSKIGLIPDSGGTFILPRLVGLQRATALMMLAEKVSADDAVQMGMIYKTYEDEALYSEAYKMAMYLSTMPTKSLGLTKRLLNQSMTNDLVTQLAHEEVIQAEAGQTKDFKEGVQAFLEKRKPVFVGK